MKSSSKGALAHEVFENDDNALRQESVEIEGFPAVDLTTASEFETGHDNDNREESDGLVSQSDSDKSMDDEVEEISYRKVKKCSFLVFLLI